jgi:hypothetical protein
MKTKLNYAVLFIALLAASCNNSVISSTPTPTSTPTLIPTATKTPTRTPSPIPPTATAVEIAVVPRWMLVSQPYYSVMISNSKWNYKADSWGENAACIDYVLESEDTMSFEQCFGVSMEGQTFESLLEPFIENGFETLQPSTTFGGVEKIGLVAKVEDGNRKHYFEVVETQGYVSLVELSYVTESNSSLEAIYTIKVAYTMNYLLRDSLQKAHLIPSPAPTPMAKNQRDFYEVVSPMLIGHAQANAFYYGTWDILGDQVSDKNRQVCRKYEDRTNEDVLWVGFMNCILDKRDFSLDQIAKNYQGPQVVTLESSHTYKDEFVLYAFQAGHTYFDAFLVSGDYIYTVRLESRTIASQTPKDVFSQNADDFIHDVLMENLTK